MSQISTRFTELLGTKLPIIGAPMFLVSNPKMVSEITLNGGLGVFPTLNCRSLKELESWLDEIESKVGDKPYGVNLIVHKSNKRFFQDLDLVLRCKASLIVSSLGDPSPIIERVERTKRTKRVERTGQIEQVERTGQIERTKRIERTEQAERTGQAERTRWTRKKNVKVICDVINLKHGEKALRSGADGLIVVSAGAGGHAGSLSPFASIPWFKKMFSDKLIIAAGGVSSGTTMAAALCLGADAVSVGTRFIASKEAKADQGYKNAIVEATPEDIFMSRALSGVNASVIKTKHNQDFYEWDQSLRGKIYQYFYYSLMKKGLKLKKKFSWSNVWSAGQSVGEVHDIITCREILLQFEKEYLKVLNSLPK